MLHPHEYKRVKAGTTGAKPAVLVSGKEVGKVIHVKVDRGAAGVAQRGSAAKREAPKPGSAAAVKGANERLERRRMAWQVDRALEELCAIKPPEASVLVKLAAVFGTGSIIRGAQCPGRWDTPVKLQKAFAAAGSDELWAVTVTEKHGLRDQLAYRRQANLDGAHAIVKWLTEELRGAPAWKAVVEASVAEVPAPKSLGGLKQTQPAKVAGKAKPKKPAPAKRGKAA